MKSLKLLPGIALSVAIAGLACWLESLLPVHVIGSAVIAMFIGMTLNSLLKDTQGFSAGLRGLRCLGDLRCFPGEISVVHL